MQESSASTVELDLTWRHVLWLALAGMLAAGTFLFSSARGAGPGFPLDDSWIHLTYARNLAERGQWAFLEGQPSAGSTAPLWTFLLAPGFLAGLGPHYWTYALGITCLVGLGVVTERIIRQEVISYRPTIPWAGLLMVTEWHMVWAAVSGMETILFTLLAAIVLALMLGGSRSFVSQGVLVGLSVWVRPDGLTLLIPLALALGLGSGPVKEKLKSFLLIQLGLGALLVPYLLMNLALSGTPFPNTLYAKLAEYAAWQQSPLSLKLESFSLIFFAGAALIMLPAVVGAVVVGLRRRRWAVILALGWALGYAALYAYLLPVYQNGRYLMPGMAAYLIVGLLFLAEWLPTAETRPLRLVRFAWLATLATISAIFYFYGAGKYSRDVALIQHEMVVSAEWVAKELPRHELVAAHDIGALGFFAPQVRLLDLAGLISPEVVPFITDEIQLAQYIAERQAGYVILVPHHYPILAKLGQPIFTAPDPADDAYEKAMVIYRWTPP
jgi:hypothetical protein